MPPEGSFPSSAEWLPLPPTVTVELPSSVITATGAAALMARAARAATASSASVVSALLTGTSASTNSTRGGGGAPAASTGTYVVNPARDTEFESIRLRPGMRQLLQANPPPHNESNNEFCVSWWGRGGCYSNCGRSATHRPFANAAERERLLTHVCTHLMAPAAALAAST